MVRHFISVVTLAISSPQILYVFTISDQRQTNMQSEDKLFFASQIHKHLHWRDSEQIQKYNNTQKAVTKTQKQKKNQNPPFIWRTLITSHSYVKDESHPIICTHQHCKLLNKRTSTMKGCSKLVTPTTTAWQRASLLWQWEILVHSHLLNSLSSSIASCSRFSSQPSDSPNGSPGDL